MLNNVNFRPNYVELWDFRCYSLATFLRMLYTKTGLQFCELVTKILIITSREQMTEWNYFRTAKDKTIRQGTSCSNRTKRQTGACLVRTTNQVWVCYKAFCDASNVVVQPWDTLFYVSRQPHFFLYSPLKSANTHNQKRRNAASVRP